MDEGTINDLKTFIATTVTTTVRQEIGDALAESERRLETKIDNAKEEILAAVGEVLYTHIDDCDTRIAGCEVRLTRLEHRPA